MNLTLKLRGKLLNTNTTIESSQLPPLIELCELNALEGYQSVSNHVSWAEQWEKGLNSRRLLLHISVNLLEN